VPLAITVAVSVALLFAFSPARRGKAHGGDLPLSAPLPESVPPGVALRVGDPLSAWIFRHNGWDKALPFTIQWAEITGGPDVTEAFHAGALDVGLGANVPPIHADWSGIAVRIIGFRQFPGEGAKHAWTFGLSPQTSIRAIADLKGKRIAFSPSQVQGQVVLETLRAAHMAQKDVTLVELPSSVGGDVYTNALASGVIDAAPLAAGLVAERYVSKFGDRGARLLPHPPFRDDGSAIYVPETVLADRGKAAALRVYVHYWGLAAAWANSHPEELAQGYFVGKRGLSAQDARLQVNATYPVEIPRDWSQAIAFQQAAIDILAPGTGRPTFPAATLFDRRFETIAADAARKDHP
jgi:sulfonate transport system substrate-binding protein